MSHTCYGDDIADGQKPKRGEDITAIKQQSLALLEEGRVNVRVITMTEKGYRDFKGYKGGTIRITSQKSPDRVCCETQNCCNTVGYEVLDMNTLRQFSSHLNWFYIWVAAFNGITFDLNQYK